MSFPPHSSMCVPESTIVLQFARCIVLSCKPQTLNPMVGCRSGAQELMSCVSCLFQHDHPKTLNPGPPSWPHDIRWLGLGLGKIRLIEV